MARKPLLAAVGALIALAVVSANPPHPALPPLPGAPSALPPPPPNSTGVLPVDRGSTGAPLPATPNAPPATIPVAPPPPVPTGPSGPLDPPAPPSPFTVPNAPRFPQPPVLPSLPPVPPVGAQPVAPASPPPTQILEPVSAVHRFAGTYLGGTSSRALVYAEANGKAEVFVYALDGAKEPVARCGVQSGKPAFGTGRAFVLSPRDLTVVGLDGRAEWVFSLPGRADNGELLIAVAGFDGANVLVASSEPLKTGKAIGRVYVLDAASGKQVGFRKIEDGFRNGALFTVELQARTLLAACGSSVWTISIDRADPPARMQHMSEPLHLSATLGRAFVGVRDSLLVAQPHIWTLTAQAASTGPAGFVRIGPDTFVLVPTRTLQSSQHHLGAFLLRGANDSNLKWQLDVPKAITAPPVARGDSVYFAAGNVLYRASAATGAVHWKHTLALGANDALTGMTFDGDDLVAWGGGVVARVSDRGDPVTPVAPAPRERVRQIFNFGGGLFPSQ